MGSDMTKASDNNDSHPKGRDGEKVNVRLDENMRMITYILLETCKYGVVSQIIVVLTIWT
jgi:hypothetical protein